MDEEVPEFSSTEAECAFWRGRARELKTDLDEFTEDSHQLEKELEITIKLKDDQLTDLRHKHQRQQHDIDNLMAKLKQSENESLQWEQRYRKEKAEADLLRKHTRELEQKNDDLERAHRIVSESVTEFERMLNREYEKNVMLEVEYEMEKENSQIQLQRLMDEARGTYELHWCDMDEKAYLIISAFISDLKQELKIQQKQPGAVHSDEDDDTRHNKATVAATEEKLSNDSENVEKAETEMASSERRGSLRHLANGVTNGQAKEGAPINHISSVAAAGTRSAAATMQRDTSLKRKLILAFSYTKRAIRPACIFGPRRK